MELTQLIQHPEQMDKDTLYDLRSLVALHPYFQTARLLMLQNLYLLHDPTFDEELRKAAVYITDRKLIFDLVEAAHYQLADKKSKANSGAADSKNADNDSHKNRTLSLIDTFLDSIPADDENTETGHKRKPTPADAAVDYVAYLLDIETADAKTNEQELPQMKGQSLIDNFINKGGGKIQLKETPEYVPDTQFDADSKNADSDDEDEYFTETLAKIYIKQGRYSKAKEIIQRLNLQYPQKNIYFADQIRFLEKLILNSKNK